MYHWQCRYARFVICLALAGFLLATKSTQGAPPTSVQEWYWWQDELRTSAFALATARFGNVSQWPRISVAAGTAKLPVPLVAAGSIQADGKLDEAAWQQATRFPVGPLFDTWRAGPFTIQVSVCRDAQNLYLAIESPRDLTDLRALSADAELFRIGAQPFHVGGEDGIAATSIRQSGNGQVIELAVPLSGPVDVSFPVDWLT